MKIIRSKYFALWVTGFILMLFIGCRKEQHITHPLQLEAPPLTNAVGAHFTEICLDLTQFTNLVSHTITNETKLDFRLDRKFSPQDINMAKRGINFLERLTGATYAQNFTNVYWSDALLANGYLGMTIWKTGRIPWDAYIVIASELKIIDDHNLNQWRDWATVLVHEFDHSAHINPERITQANIEYPINVAFDYCRRETIERRYPFNEADWGAYPYRTTLELAAYEAGIPFPWVYYADFDNNMLSRPLYFLLQLPQF